MGYQHPRKTSKKHEYQKPLRERKKDKKRAQPIKHSPKCKHKVVAQEIAEITLRRLHTLGKQKFASTPYSDHFNRWLANVEEVLSEFELHPTITLDDQYIEERTETLTNIKRDLEERQKKEATLDQKIKNLAFQKSNLQLINTEFAARANALKAKRSQEIKRFNNQLEHLRKEQEKVIRLKTGFFRGISRKSREQKEVDIAQEITEVQKNLELALLDFKAQKNKLQNDFERKREPLLEEIKICQRDISGLDIDGSLEERWFSCQTLMDSLNILLQRNATLPAN
jgi:hypothetical protein